MRKLEFFLLLLALSVATFFRVYKLTDIPFGLNNDAAWEGLAALDILKGNITPYLPYAAEGWRGEGIIRIFVAFFTALFGNDPITIRLASVVFGIGLVIPLFLLIKLLFNTKLAFLTTFFMAISGWHITMSKTGWRAIAVPFFATLTFLFFFRAIKYRKSRDFILTGVFLALVSLYTYDTGRIIIFLFTAWLIYLGISTRGFFSTHGKSLFYILLSFVVTAFPMIAYAVGHWENFTSRSSFLFIGSQIEQAGSLMPLWNNIKTSTLLFNVNANGNDFFIFEPLVDSPVAWLLPIGFVIVLWRVIKTREQNYFFVLLWFIASLIPGILSAPNGNRAIGAIPTVYFFTSIGLLFIANQIARLLQIKRQVVTTSGIILFCLLSAYLTYRDYLGPHRRELVGFYPETLITTQYIRTIWDKYEIYLTDNYPRELLTYYLYKEGLQSPFVRNYVWFDNSFAFLELLFQRQSLAFQGNTSILGATVASEPKGLVFFMFATPQNEIVSSKLLNKYPGAQKRYIWYDNDNIHRPASLVVLIPVKK